MSGRLAGAFATLMLACAALCSVAARAQATLDARTERVEVWPHARVLVDPEGRWSAEEVQAMGDRFSAPGGAYATLGIGREVVWLRVPLAVRAGGEGEWILDIDYALLRNVEVYVAAGGKLARVATLGDGQPFASRPMRGRSHSVPLHFAAPSDAQLLLRIDTPGARILPIALERLPAFHSRALAEQLLQGALGGLALVLLLYSLFQWYSLRETLYLKYALLTLCSATFSIHFFGIGEMYLWTGNAWLQRHLAGASSMMAAAATALFVEDALSGELNGWMRRALRAVAAIQGLATVAYGADLIDLQAVAVLMSTTGLAPALIGLPGALAKARRGESVGWWFLAAWLGSFIASAILVGVVRGRVGATFWTLHSFQAGAPLDMLIFMRIAVLRSATRHRAAQQAARDRDRLHSLAHSDPLTGLLNRRGLDEALTASVAAATPERMVALYMLDLDGFKPVNDLLGHDAGDRLLRVVGERLRGCMRAGDAVARLGGDEFVVMAEGLATESQARELGAKLLEAFRSPFVIGTETCAVRATIGYSLASADAGDRDALLKAADAAMYAGKQQGKDRLVRAA